MILLGQLLLVTYIQQKLLSHCSFRTWILSILLGFIYSDKLRDDMYIICHRIINPNKEKPTLWNIELDFWYTLYVLPDHLWTAESWTMTHVAKLKTKETRARHKVSTWVVVHDLQFMYDRGWRKGKVQSQTQCFKKWIPLQYEVDYSMENFAYDKPQFMTIDIHEKDDEHCLRCFGCLSITRSKCFKGIKKICLRLN